MGKSDPSEKLWSGACPSWPPGVCSPRQRQRHRFEERPDLRRGETMDATQMVYWGGVNLFYTKPNSHVIWAECGSWDCSPQNISLTHLFRGQLGTASS